MSNRGRHCRTAHILDHQPNFFHVYGGLLFSADIGIAVYGWYLATQFSAEIRLKIGLDLQIVKKISMQ